LQSVVPAFTYGNNTGKTSSHNKRQWTVAKQVNLVYPEYKAVSFGQGMGVQIYAKLFTFNQVYRVVFTYVAFLLRDPV